MSTAKTASAPSRHVVTLSRTTIFATIVAVLVGMTIYTAIEYMFRSPVALEEFLTHHLLPALLIGVVIWITLSFLLQSKVVRPVRKIFEHLYLVGSGRLAPLELESGVEEINTVVEGINLLVQRLSQSPDNEGMDKAVEDVAKLRADLKRVIAETESDSDAFLPVMRDLRLLERHLLSALEAAKRAA